MSVLSVVIPMLKVYYIGLKVLLYQLFNKSFLLPVFPKQNGRVAIVTGGARGIGYETARHLARLGMHIIIAGNSENEGQEAVKRIKEENLNQKVEFIHLDLTSLKSVHWFVKTFSDRGLPLHILVNNAGVMLVPERKTQDGFEEHIGLNYLGHFLLTKLLLDKLKQSGCQESCARIVTVSSATHYCGELDLEDLQSCSCYSSHHAYAQSKLALVLFTYYLQQRLTAEGSHVTTNAVDPGVVNTDLYQNICWPAQLLKGLVAGLLFRTPEEGASTSIYAAAAPELEGVGGCYLYNGQRTKSADASYDEELQSRLWTLSCSLVGIQEQHCKAY
ncbi:dehydrogenase/reductase SDR family member on chromosome X isoform X1 [Polyodon spathula]|uniref:dehydrogenase/reductase SDR family member on chromosome X isoform X1 n=2 Tax=Polyodon spathula TaxID=7913 RepID=UPI001B7DAC14|nr:dehydrogenase/reductase SDR family member on chromosome X isoform X1 [Polyodon spathula]